MRDVEPSFTPEWQWTGLLRYEFDLFSGTAALQADASYQSSFFHNIRNFKAHNIDERVVGNLRSSWTDPSGRWEASLFVNNVADERYKTIGFDLTGLCGCTEESYGYPRWVGGGVRFSF
jgi:iron complex outermembrane receptor protein